MRIQKHASRVIGNNRQEIDI